MRSYDTPGYDVTFDIAPADFDKYNAGDLNVQIGDHVGITLAPVDREDGKLVVATHGVFNRRVANPGAKTSNTRVYFKPADGTLTTDSGDGDGDAAHVPFGIMVGTCKANATSDVLVKLVG